MCDRSERDRQIAVRSAGRNARTGPRGDLVVRGKGGGRDTLPMPVDAGQALADYLCLRGLQRRRTLGRSRIFRLPGRVTMTDVPRCAGRVGAPGWPTSALTG